MGQSQRETLLCGQNSIMKIEIYDTTLRDGMQGCGMDFSPEDKLAVLHTLDRLGVTYIEVGMLTDAASLDYCRQIAEEKLETAIPVIFGQTCRPGEACRDNPTLRAMADCPLPVAAIYGKSWLYQVQQVLHTTEEENLRMIWDTVAFLKSAGKQVFFDAEHFFDGYSDNAEYALRVVDTAFTAGADRVILCDTNGGMLPDTIGLVVSAVIQQYGIGKIGIHCHNDLGMAAACSVSAVLSGASQVQGTISGFGERCGNANLNTLIPVLQLKLGFDCIGENLPNLTSCARQISETANRAFNENEPFVGGYAFTHKAGTHIDGVTKAPRSFEHMDPAAVGNRRNIVISSLSGRAALADKMRSYLPPEDLTKDSPRLLELSRILKEREALGFDYEDAAASLALVIEEVLNQRKRYFDLLHFKVMVENSPLRTLSDFSEAESMTAIATIKIAVGGTEELTAGEGNGPVNAMDEALRRALLRFYPQISQMRLTDYRVRVLNSGATASVVRVLIESTDGIEVWRTVGVSPDIITASWQALRDSVEYMLSRRLSPAQGE